MCRAAALEARETAVAARERAAGAMDNDLMAATLQALPNGHSAGAASSAQVGEAQNALHGSISNGSYVQQRFYVHRAGDADGAYYPKQAHLGACWRGAA